MREGIRGRREPFEISTSGNLPTYLHVHTYVERASINRVSPPTNDGNHRFHQPYALPRQHTRERAYSFSTRQTFYPEKLPRMAEKIIVPRWNEGRSAGERGSLSLSLHFLRGDDTTLTWLRIEAATRLVGHVVAV